MAKKKNKKKKVTKATPPTIKVVKGNHYLIDEIQEDLKKDLQEQFFKALSKTSPTSQGIMQVTHPPMQQMPKQTGKSWLHAQLYGKAAQMGNYTGEDAEQHKWLTWMRHQMLKLHPGVTKTEISKELPWHRVRFDVYINALGQMYKFTQAVSMDLMVSAPNLEDLGHHILKDLEAQIDKAFPQATPKLGNMTVVQSKFMDPDKLLLVPEDLHDSFSKYAAGLKEYKFLELATNWLNDHKPPPPPIPVPPDEDKDFKNSPVVEYNMALKKIENHAKDIGGAGKIWGEMYNTVQHYEKEKILAQKKAHEQGFRGNVVQDSLRQVLPCLYQQVKCPVCQHSDNMADMIIHLNDGEMWSREQIADWAESLDIDISVKETK